MAISIPYLKVIVLEKNIGPGLARNFGIKNARGNKIALLDDDDEWLDENKLSNQIRFLNENPEYVIVGSAVTDFVNETNRPLFTFKPKLNDCDIRANILLSNQFITSSVMFRKEAFEKVGGFAAMYLAEDYDLWLKLALQGKIVNIQGCKTRYMKRSSGAQQSHKSEMNKIVLKLIKRNKFNFPNYWLALIKAYIRIILG